MRPAIGRPASLSRCLNLGLVLSFGTTIHACGKVKVQWQNERLQTRVRTFTGWTARIIQHEIDHCDGVLI